MKHLLRRIWFQTQKWMLLGEKQLVRTVGLAAKGDGTKLKPFIVFKGGKRDPGGCTKYIQAPVVSWNKPFKAICTET